MKQINFITCQALKFSERLNKLPATHFLKEVYEVDKSLHHERYRSWYSFIQHSMHSLNVSENNFDCGNVSHNISKKYRSDIYEDINLFKREINDNELHTYSKNIWQFLFATLFILWPPKIVNKRTYKN